MPTIVQRLRQQWSILHPRVQLFYRHRQWWSLLQPPPTLSEAPAPGVESLSHAPVLSHWLAPGVDHFSPAVSHAARGRGLQGSVSGQSSTSRRRHALPLPSGWRRVEGKSGRVYYWHVHTSQMRWTPPGSDDDDEDEEDEEDEEEEEDEDEEDEDMDETCGTESRFPAGFQPMRMGRWFTSGNCRQGWECMFAHSVSELHPQARGQGP